MKRPFKIVLIVFVLVNCILSVYLGQRVYQIWRSRKMVQGASVTILPKYAYFKNPQSSLEYFYEPVPNKIIPDEIPWLQKPVSFSINNDSLNSIKDYTVHKPVNTLRIIALGDSFTFGDHVNTAEAWPARLEQLLRDDSKERCKTTTFEVLNLGLNGFDIQSEVERFKIRGKKYTPDLVIWFLIDNDFTEIRELMQERTEAIYNKLYDSHALDESNPWYKPLMLAQQEFRKKYGQDEIYAMQDSFMQDFNTQYDGPLILMSFSDLHEGFKKHIQSWVGKRKEAYYYMEPTEVESDPTLHLLDYHPNAMGHEMIARNVLQELKARKLISCFTEE